MTYTGGLRIFEQPACPAREEMKPVQVCTIIRAPAPGIWEQCYCPLRAAIQKIATFADRQESRYEAAANRAAIDQQAERILDVYGNSILRYAYSYLHNMSDAEEVLQDTLLQFLKTAPVFESAQHEKAWLLRVAANLSKNRIDYNAHRRTDELNDELVAEQRQDLSFVWDAVKSLPVKYREVVHLFYYEGYSTQQVAQILKLKEPTVRSLLHRGRERLKALLKEEYDFEETV